MLFFLKQAFLETSVHILFFAEIMKATKKSQKNHENSISSFARVAVK